MIVAEGMGNQAKTSSEVVTFLGIGDVHGHWDSVIQAIDTATASLGVAPDLVLQVGDAEPHRDESDLQGCHTPKKYRSMGVFSALRPGDLLSPVYFIGGNHEPYMALDSISGPFPALWGKSESVFYLGRAGAALLVGKLCVAWLSGIYSPEADPALRSKSLRMRTYFSNEEVDRTLDAASNLGGVDVLITHDWPSGLRLGRGNYPTRDLVEAIRPTLHLSGHMHSAFEGVIDATVVNALNAVPPVTKKQGRKRFGWWRLYERDATGAIHCLQVGG
ncbi:MAG: metallophosphoesterase [Ferrimicrobium sp.]